MPEIALLRPKSPRNNPRFFSPSTKKITVSPLIALFLKKHYIPKWITVNITAPANVMIIKKRINNNIKYIHIMKPLVNLNYFGRSKA